MILADTSVWVDHFRRMSSDLRVELEQGVVVCHPFVLGELACGALSPRNKTLELLSHLPPAMVSTHEETMRLVEGRHLYQTGIGWIDAHLVASALLGGYTLWTLDRKLRAAALRAGCTVM